MKYKYYNAHYEGKKIDPSARWLVIFNGVIAVATAIVAVFTAISIHDQGNFSSAQISRMDSAIKLSNTAILKQDSASQKQLRAYVTFVSNSFNGYQIDTIRLKNAGQTLAYDVETSIGDTAIFKTRMEFPLLKKSSDQSKSIMGPGEIDCIYVPPLDLLNYHILNTQLGLEVIYYWGKVTYSDVFGVPHWEKFRIMQFRDVAHNHWTTLLTNEGNDADRN